MNFVIIVLIDLNVTFAEILEELLWIILIEILIIVVYVNYKYFYIII